MKYQIKERADKKLSLIPKRKAKLAVYFTEKMGDIQNEIFWIIEILPNFNQLLVKIVKTVM